MSEHDDLCPILTHADGIACRSCDLIARVRADEREQVGRVWAKREDLLLGDIEVARADERAALNGKLLRLYTQNTHAEAVAARLVEVVCEQDDLIQIVGVDATNHRAAAADMRRERDAARAEVERLRSPEWEAEVRADERNRWGLGWVAAADNVQALAHAEAVAARLVEVICWLDAELDHCHGCRATLRLCLDWHGKTGGKCCPDCEHPAEAAGFALLRAERDAARDAARDDERERIAQEIEAFHAEQCGGPESPWSHICTCSYAARIARGGTQ